MHLLFQQLMPLQQSEAVVQVWPYSAQVLVLASTAPASEGGGERGGMPQIPCVEPIGWMQVEPAQQSPLIEHGPAAGTQAEGTPASKVVMGGA